MSGVALSGKNKNKIEMIKKTLQRFAVTTGLLLTATVSMAGDSLVLNDKNPQAKAPVVHDATCNFCDIFDINTIYKNEHNNLIQSVSLHSRYHGQHHSTSLDFDGIGRVGASFWEHRRFRHGIKVKFLNDFTFVTEWNVPADDQLTTPGQPFFANVHEINITWKPTDDFFVSVGRQKVKFTQEWAESSKTQLTPERSHIANEVIASGGFPYGVNTGFKAWGIDHQIGVWLSGADNPQRGITFDTRGGASYLAKASLNDNTDLHFGYLYTNNSGGDVNGEGNADRLELSPYNHAFALGTETHWKKAGLYTDFIYGIDRDSQGGNDEVSVAGANDIPSGDNTFGLYILPYYDVTERFQLVGRYAFASNTRIHRGQRAPFDEDADGLSPFQQGGRPNLEDVHTFFIGANYRICGDKLKLIGGYEYLTGDVRGGGGVTGDTWILGVRTFF